jgi:molybdopterin molybdotransferase
MEPMITVDQAQQLVVANLPPVSIEEVRFDLSLGRVLAERVVATSDVPPFDRAAMDGFAVRAEDLQNTPVELEIVGEVRAGQGDPGEIGPGQCRAIMTGAPLPDGADAVQMVEKTCRQGDRVTILAAVRAGDHLTPKASEASAGTEVIEVGRVVGPAEIAVMATFGLSVVRVVSRPRVALLATGDELVDVSAEPGPGQIRNSNAWSLASQLRTLGVDPEILGVARDDRRDLSERIASGLGRDVLILSGGVSMGEYDLVPEVLRSLGVEVLFNRVAMKPGKPTLFGCKGHKLVFGLPGNPVSTFVAFENFVRPALGRLCGLRTPELPCVRGELLHYITQVPGRKAYLPARTRWTARGWTVEPLRLKGSADILGFSRADSLFVFPSEIDRLKQGETVEVLLLPDYYLRRAAAGD